MKNMNENINLADELYDKIENELGKLKKVKILVLGKTGAGKSTLINALFREDILKTGVGYPMTKNIVKVEKDGVPLTLYDTRGLELDNDSRLEVYKEVANFVSDMYIKGNDEKLNLIYFCINAQGLRIEKEEEELIRTLSKENKVIIVLTKFFSEEAKDFYDFIKNMNMGEYAIAPVLAKNLKINRDNVIVSHGLEDLVQMSMDALEDEYQISFNNAQHADLKLKAEKARSWAKKYIASSFGVGFVPIPFSDASVLVPMELTMLAHITAIFGVPVNKKRLASIIAGLGGTMGATYLGRFIVSNALKFFPGAGTVVAGLISGTTASAIMASLAFAYIEVLTVLLKKAKTGDDIDDKELEEMLKKLYKDNLKNHKKLK